MVENQSKDHIKVGFIGVPGSGKSQPLDAKVLTASGWTSMGEICVGDEVVDPEGGTSKVVSVHPQGLRPIFKVTFSDGASTECDIEHLWQTRSRRHKGWRVQTLADIEAQRSLGHSDTRHYIPMMGKVDLSLGDTPVDPYLLGLLLGDGGLSDGTVNITTADRFIVDEVSRVLPEGLSLKNKSQYTYTISRSRTVVASGRYQTSFDTKTNPIQDALKELGLLRKKSFEKFVPEGYLFNSFDTRLAVLQGLMDSDGHVGSAVEFTSTSEQLAKDVQTLVRSLGGRATLQEKKTSYSYSGQKRAGRLAYRVFLSLPTDVCPVRLPRKVRSWEKRVVDPSRKIIEVEYVGDKLAKCITLDSKNQLYVTNDFVVTHNSTVAQAVQVEMGGLGRTTSVCPEYAREFINRVGNPEHVSIQQSILFKQQRREDTLAKSCDILFCDSMICNSYIYGLLITDPKSLQQIKVLRNIYKWCVLDALERYDIVIYLPKQFEVVDDGCRSPEFTDTVEKSITGFLNLHSPLFPSYHEVYSECTDPKEILADRVKQVKKIVSSHLKRFPLEVS